MSAIEIGDIHAAYRKLDARGWDIACNVNIARHALGRGVVRRGRWWFLLFALALFAACGEHTVPPDAQLPKCSDVGCPDSAFCRSDGVCSCIPSPGAQPVACVLEAP